MHSGVPAERSLPPAAIRSVRRGVRPVLVPPEAPVVGSLTDDITDIYRDVITGLREYESGRRAQAVWEWGFGVQRHWGEHATGAIRALHCWLAGNACDRLAAEAEQRVAPDGGGIP